MFSNVLGFLLQITTDAEAVAAAATDDGSVSVLDLLMKGGIAMIPIFLLSIGAIYIIVERTMVISKSSKDPNEMMDRVKKLVLDGDIQKAQAVCQEADTPVSRMVAKGIQRIGSPLRTIEASIEKCGQNRGISLRAKPACISHYFGSRPYDWFFWYRNRYD